MSKYLALLLLGAKLYALDGIVFDDTETDATSVTGIGIERSPSGYIIKENKDAISVHGVDSAAPTESYAPEDADALLRTFNDQDHIQTIELTEQDLVQETARRMSVNNGQSQSNISELSLNQNTAMSIEETAYITKNAHDIVKNTGSYTKEQVTAARLHLSLVSEAAHGATPEKQKSTSIQLSQTPKHQSISKPQYDTPQQVSSVQKTPETAIKKSASVGSVGSIVIDQNGIDIGGLVKYNSEHGFSVDTPQSPIPTGVKLDANGTLTLTHESPANNGQNQKNNQGINLNESIKSIQSLLQSPTHKNPKPIAKNNQRPAKGGGCGCSCTIS
ncbi:hypothetical protein [Candidatus Cytomitobacter primus]|uniref:Uncharacterized protein n=1 Tax=Candidatus Cytomitobacter primus TaxID=2066024 RepID=A0A5C0UG08_9PROT|nr:hypothetical protein [Candidatus Cytomitobacter primus]QEK38611.1 hypothetical protein FZC34_01670 [Candidatus Cytomitobacter primus]